jgi:hypothetical protein
MPISDDDHRKSPRAPLHAGVSLPVILPLGSSDRKVSTASIATNAGVVLDFDRLLGSLGDGIGSFVTPHWARGH